MGRIDRSTGIGGVVLIAAALAAAPASADPTAPTNCANSPFADAQFYGNWWTEHGSWVNLSANGTLHHQYRSFHKVGTWALLPLDAVPGHSSGPVDPGSVCTLWLRWLHGAVSGQPESQYDPPTDELYQPLSVSDETIEFAGDGAQPISWRRTP